MLEQTDKPRSTERLHISDNARAETQFPNHKNDDHLAKSKPGVEASIQAANKYLPSVSLFDSGLKHDLGKPQDKMAAADSRPMDGPPKDGAAKDGAKDGANSSKGKPMDEGDRELSRLNNTIGKNLNGSLTDRIIGAVSGNEGNFSTITKNDNGHGVSVGIRQWNQKVGELPDLLKSMHDKDPDKFNNIFGKYSNNLQSESWVRHANMAGNHDLMNRMKTALADPEFQQVQVDKARDFTNRTIQTAKNFGFHSELGQALVSDLSNQLGEAGARNLLRRAGLHPGSTIKDEEAMINRVAHMTHRPNNKTRFALLADSFSPNQSTYPNRLHMDDVATNLA